MAGAGDFDYESHGQGYAAQRRTDPRIAALVHEALGGARTVLNVGAGAGSYEPKDRYVLAVEPSPAMRAQRPAHLAPAINAVAEHLPFDDDAVDAAMAMVTIHQWSDTNRGLRELRRLADYAPELIAAEHQRDPPIDSICATLGGPCTVHTVPIPIDCVDGFTEAYYARPEQFLDPAVRRSQSAWGFVDPAAEQKTVARLRDDLESGAWASATAAGAPHPTSRAHYGSSSLTPATDTVRRAIGLRHT